MKNIDNLKVEIPFTKDQKEKIIKAINKQRFKFNISQSGEHIRGWPLLKIHLTFEIEPLLDFLESARNIGLETATYHFLKNELNKAKEEVDCSGKIAENNCVGKEVYDLLSKAKKNIERFGGVSKNNINIVDTSLQDIMDVSFSKCR